PRTINGLAEGLLDPNRPRLVGGDGQPQPIDVAHIVEHFHGVGEEAKCVYTGMPYEGVNILDGNPQNFLITNIEPVTKAWMDSQHFFPKTSITKVISFSDADFEVEIFGAPLFRAEAVLEDLEIPGVPVELGLAHDEAVLLWIWNQLTKVQLLKGLRSLTRRNKQTGVSVALTNKDVLEFTFKLLHQDFTPQENNNGI
ncbi:MAG: hypothetical protein DRQ35_04635, partial [Gammaproteobacteria bacterium]